MEDIIDDLVRTLDRHNKFGLIKGSNFETQETEELEKQRKYKEELKNIEEQRKIDEEEKKRQEYEDYLLTLEEESADEFETKLEEALSQNRPSAGRGSRLNQQIQEEELYGQQARLSRWLHRTQPTNPVFKREQTVREQIHWVNGGAAIQSNHTQKVFWSKMGQSESLPPASSCSSIDSYEQFEDIQDISSPAEPSPASISPAPHSPLPSREADPPVDCAAAAAAQREHSPPVPRPSTSRRPRKSRLAARFSNMHLDDEEETRVADRLAVLSSTARPLVPPRISQSRAVSINDLSPLQRIIKPKLPLPEAFTFDLPPEGFSYNKDDFPAL